MSDDKQQGHAPDDQRINVHEAHEVRYWTRMLDVSEARLRQIVEHVGTSVSAVRNALGR
ncbi:DUF3606 domain-containing protein [Solimonas soli]|uniref:DUF3606 domain-containing protein n=1 Tax=Solimonas soli TaxID=413479 RepID=UPI0004AFEEC7|nr:DUF3606 domain-containing protein [Solimonas soli]